MSQQSSHVWVAAGNEATAWARTLKGMASTIVSVLSILGAIGSIFGGILIAVQSQQGSCTLDSSGSESCGSRTHPYVALGVGVAAGGLILYLTLYLVAVYMKASGWKMIYDVHRTWGR